MQFPACLTTPDAIALCSDDEQLTYAQLDEQVALRAAWLKQGQTKCVGLALENSIEWVLMDLACQRADVCCVPVPVFFSQAQREHLLKAAAIDLMISAPLAGQENLPFGRFCAEYFTPETPAQRPKGTGKITFTSGSTGQPKGVCLSHASLQITAQALVDTLAMQDVVHLCLLPLATLLENVAGIYAPLLAGGKVVLATDTQRGFMGSQLKDAAAMLTLINRWQPTSLILVPELLTLLIHAWRQGWRAPASLQFIAVGGATVSEALLKHAQAIGLPVYQGYGLSECVSVVALNTPANNDPQSVGRPLPHNRLEIEDNELLVHGNLFLGYLNQPESWYPQVVHTGDKASFKQGYVRIDGRFKNLLINSLGRNISPEWVEAEVMASGLFKHVMVLGDSQPFCSALLVPAQDALPFALVEAAIDATNARLPDYAKIKAWHLLNAAEIQDASLFTANGKLKRDAMSERFAVQINAFYQIENNVESGAYHEAI
ncbi:AMP-binding protein [Bowmanella pacifica]|uniref:Long-chain-fatty-acid--CoA ligase n=1 Tax=Bowmanella pacifica TaxID=502051 RepID=A0A917YY22_9ALTE|nr:AMP-binding protein [Bowmanella pacifica]GGO67913.1 long-chain-fatty-acid--CoA ligase [Bowmanella pacifica]